MLLVDFVGDYLLGREACPKYRRSLELSVACFGRFVGRAAVLADLTAATINRYLVQLGERGLARSTIRGERSRLLSLWRDAFDREMVDAPPLRVRKIAVSSRPVEAWTKDEIERLLAVAAGLRGRFKNRWLMAKADFARALILCAYDSGARLGDLERWTFADLRDDGLIFWTQHKTGKPQTAILYPETLAACRRLRHPSRPTIFGGVLGRRYFYRWVKEIVAAAGLSGTFRYLRRSSGSILERDNPGWGSRHLGNLPSVFDRHYRAPRIAEDLERRPRPPQLLGA